MRMNQAKFDLNDLAIIKVALLKYQQDRLDIDDNSQLVE
jgi:hypothetical protein